MATEIERKFLIDRDRLTLPEEGQLIRQGYIATVNNTVVRVRIRGEMGFVTLKGKTRGAARSEFEYPVPLEDATAMLDELCAKPLIEKVRYLVPWGRHLWEVDIFAGDNLGLCLAEIELTSEDETFERPPWVAEEVTQDVRYHNSQLAVNPYKNWMS